MINKNYTKAALGLAVLALTTNAGFAANDQEDKWRFSTAPLFWMSGIEGDITVQGNTADVDLGFDEMSDVTEFGFSTHLELRKEKFGFYVNPSYAKLEGDGQTPGDSFEQDFWLVDGGAFFNVVNHPGERPFALDLTAGLRYLNVQTDLTLGAGDFSRSTKLLDPTVGFRASKHLTKKISLNLIGDVGGFGISEGDTSDFSWQAVALVGYDINEKFTVFAGYRGVGIDAIEGSGANENGFDLTMHGAMIGVRVKW